MHRIYLTISDLQILTGTGHRNCYNVMRTIKDSLGKQKHQHITLREYSDYEKIDYNELLLALGLRKETS